MSSFSNTGSRHDVTLARLHPYQIDATRQLLRFIACRGGAILADDVGLGKSYVAAAIGATMQSAGMATTLVVPRHLMAQWKEVLELFQWSPSIESHDQLRSKPLLAAEHDELVVVDEAHRFRNQGTQRYRALAQLASGRSLLLVTATPLCNLASDVSALIRLFAADDAFRDLALYSIADVFACSDAEARRQIVAACVVRRSVENVEVTLPSMTRKTVRFGIGERFAFVDHALGELELAPFRGRVAEETLRRLYGRRFVSSPAALKESLLRLRRYLLRALDSATRGFALSPADFRRLFAAEDEEGLFQDLMFVELWGLSRADIDAGAVKRDITRIDHLITALGREDDVKCVAFMATLQTTEKPAIVFTVAIATAISLFDSLGPEVRKGLVTSRTCRDDRGLVVAAEVVLSRFREKRIDVLVTTDLSSEGLNLQAAASIVHYDLPWSPVRIDQRNGRARRLASTRDRVSAVYFVPDAGVDTRMREIIVAKERVRRSLLLGKGVTVETLPSFQTMRSRQLVPERIAATLPQATLVNALKRERAIDLETLDLLTRRYRFGVEETLREIASGPAARSALVRLLPLLRRLARAASLDG